MKHDKIFKDFLNDVVNLNQTRINKLTASSGSVIEFIKNHDEFKNIFIEDSAQGSYGHRTIIKPLAGKEFDADIVIFLKEQEGWEPKDYVNKMKSALESNATYKKMLKQGNRCVCIDYAGDFHIDIVPCVVKTLDVGCNLKQYFVCNRNENKLEQTDPDAYKAWVKDKNKTTKNNQLIKCIRLFKYLRDIKTTFSCKSILMTTLIANQIRSFDTASAYYPDIATSLRTVIGRLDDYLQLNSDMPIIENPVQQGENFNRHWDQNKFENFQRFISKYRGWIEDAYDETDREESIKKWRKVFGSKFHSTTGKATKAENYSEVLREASLESFPIPAHCLSHRWTEAKKVESIEIDVLHKPRLSVASFSKAMQHLTFPKEQSLRFEVMDSVPEGSEIYWQITNTGDEATRMSQLRGGFELGTKVKEETTSYKGNHFVEAFVVKDQILIARSGKRVIPIS
ncbi:nucleotidyltransferase [Vibrio vulnificus]|uniref:SMODS domain-containing nucleotidyltransferase n=1 Tax=Vibrio vulnificus TaxID=672 RepID=UPI001A25D67F|nr:nucleotidyltransferase [Vibrio vulnificus]ELV8750301.1 nucleotidyltransferase [Vibrio vulnificus]ELV8791827.1 nucleotidyltransferase [Vibrio vulnificus]MCA4016824.1 nucleotidyltransferase [Vibrio vulnificus]HAS6197548.1 nucleotidyltransferase [Vibrio vulnificus]